MNQRGMFIVLGLFLVAFLSMSFASAKSTCLNVNAKDIDAYIAEIPSLDSQLATCTISVDSNVHTLVGNGNVLVTVGGSKQFYATIDNKVVTGLTAGKPTNYNYEVTMDEQTFNDLLSSQDVFNDILQGIKDKKIKIVGTGFWNKVKWFFFKWFIPKPQNVPHLPEGTVGKPDNCDETYLPGHREYANNKEEWDRFSAETDNVCQSQFGKGIPNPCIHTVQLSINGNPYYLCWYNE